MKTLLALCALTLAACVPANPSPAPVTAKPSVAAYLPHHGDTGVYLIHGPDQHGVVCYARTGGGSALSCVKVQP